VPAFVATELAIWVNFIQNADGGSDYPDTKGWGSNVSRTGTLLVQQVFSGAGAGTAAAQAYLNSQWLTIQNSTWNGNFGHPYAMWAAYKGLEVTIGVDADTSVISNLHADPGDIDNPNHGWNWYEDYCEYLVNTQNANGSWNGYMSYWPSTLATAWYINILSAVEIPTNQPPIADAGPDQTLEQTSYAGAEVTLDGSGSSDPDGDPLDYLWTWDGDWATDVSPAITFPLGTTTVTLEVSDGEYTDSDTVDITVEDTTPPALSCDESVNPHGNVVPGKNRPDHAKGNNPDGFYQICVTDICDENPVIYIGTEEFIVGQSDPDDFFRFEDGCIVVKLTEAPGASPSCKSIGSDNGQAGAVCCHITLPSDPFITAVDMSGNTSVCTGCVVPPPPK
jgi:hypothetical protein